MVLSVGESVGCAAGCRRRSLGAAEAARQVERGRRLPEGTGHAVGGRGLRVDHAPARQCGLDRRGVGAAGERPGAAPGRKASMMSMASAAATRLIERPIAARSSGPRPWKQPMSSRS